MIPRPLNEIEWSDIEALRDSGREEDDTIEFKSSFKGGADFLAFNDTKQAAAVDAIAKEAIAFLNTRGGDIVIGVKEFENDHPKIEAVTPVSNALVTVDRLAQALAATIEPSQSMLAVRAIIRSPDCDEGVIVVRAQSSLRAPHRSKRAKECYVRRGRDSVPMPMDEINEMAIQRNRWRADVLSTIEGLFERFGEGVVRRYKADGPRFQARIAYFPVAVQQIDISDQMLNAVFYSKPSVVDARGVVLIDDTFQRLGLWKPVLRGRAQTNLIDKGDDDFLELVGREIRTDGTMIFDAAWRHPHSIQGQNKSYKLVPITWISDFIAQSLWSIRKAGTKIPSLLSGYLIVRFSAFGSIRFGLDRRGFDLELLQDGLTSIAPFEIADLTSVDDAFVQLQHDLFALVERSAGGVFKFDETK